MKLQAKTKHIPQSLEELFAHDELGLLADVQPTQKKASNSSDPVVNNFLELLEFVDTTGREPSLSGEIKEKALAQRLSAYRNNKAYARKVREYDTLGLLNSSDTAFADKKVQSWEDILPVIRWGFWMMLTAQYTKYSMLQTPMNEMFLMKLQRKNRAGTFINLKSSFRIFIWL